MASPSFCALPKIAKFITSQSNPLIAMRASMSITASFKPSPNPYTNIETHLSERFLIAHPPKFARIVFPQPIYVARGALRVNCINGLSGKGENERMMNLKDVLSGMVDNTVEELLKKDENKVLLDGLEKATQRVELAKRDLAELEKQEAEAKLAREYMNQLQSRASEIAECQREILEAKAMVEEAERSLIISGVDNGETVSKMEIESINRDEERVESIKAASVSAVVGTLAGLPLSLTQVTSYSQLILPLGITFISCALFGVTFRYAIRRDLDDFHLKSGAATAFGVVKGLAMLAAGPPLELETGSFLSHALDSAVYVSESLLIFFFAAAGIDFCMKMRILSPFPIQNSVSLTKEL